MPKSLDREAPVTWHIYIRQYFYVYHDDVRDGLDAYKGFVEGVSPGLNWMAGKPMEFVRRYCRRKGWNLRSVR